jgi:hypothetical protein
MNPKTTYIIPIRIESPDRHRNVGLSVRYLLKHTAGNIIIKEFSETPSIPGALGLENIDNNRLKYIHEKGDGPFHRTRLLNDMIELVETPITCNYDADIILPPESYSESEEMIMENKSDVVYPYPFSKTGQTAVFFDDSTLNKFSSSLDLNDLAAAKCQILPAAAGFCIFARTIDYKKAGGEHEGFISYGPEDGDRMNRLAKMGLVVKRIDHRNVYHMEHSRTHESSNKNPYFKSNMDLYNLLNSLSKEETIDHLRKQEYIIRRNWSNLIS